MAGLRRQIRLHDKASLDHSPSKVIWSLLPHTGALESETGMRIDSDETNSGEKNETAKGTLIVEQNQMKGLPH
jgi:hypothetical protein